MTKHIKTYASDKQKRTTENMNVAQREYPSKQEISKNTKNIFINSNDITFYTLCKYCSTQIDINDAMLQEKINNKTIYLKQILEYLQNTDCSKISDKLLQIFFFMVEKNLFHDNYFPSNLSPDYPSEEKYDIFWVHNKLIYAQLMIITESFPEYLNFSLIYRIISNTLSIDSRERQTALKFIRNIYDKNLDVRSDIKSAIISQLSLINASKEFLAFIRYIIEDYFNDKRNYVSKIKKLTKNLKNDFIVKNEEIGQDFFIDLLLPLHNHDNYELFSGELLEIEFIFFKNDTKLVDYSIKYILMHWPITNIRKQDAFLREIFDLLLNFQNVMSNQVKIDSFVMVCKCIESLNANIAKTAIKIIINPEFKGTLEKLSVICLPLLISSLRINVAKHWDPEIRKISQKSINYLTNLDPVASKRNPYDKKKDSSYKDDWNTIYKIANKKKSKNTKKICKLLNF
ncbi:hypothetical protein TVAG_005700 [Trichomonas vaginalis G3]|uniref:Phosphoprotein phosphatase n=1 Tax=Trichomonas vaginalis (strain ATCC PRA-98 / G3) TaxID=412133 RepID=A2FHQ5_TRIV3|nr:protein phosphatase regulator protein [Trichomonas vaginalis G3]EAX95555.1 hypothetical protein TVAG_005700 [Trichomonas vaginalis G3]KAI5520761.1 protein phosphatase regulator protein [Trichomonas vaginalis G3]|eukprot:XP_001308485.1 hypothetical protein [Trichomonas vaginalis G3]